MALVTTGDAGLTVKFKVPYPVPLVLMAPKTIGKVPDTDGVPEITPDVVLIASPAGNPVAL